jgi:hypothetical protein
MIVAVLIFFVVAVVQTFRVYMCQMRIYGMLYKCRLVAESVRYIATGLHRDYGLIDYAVTLRRVSREISNIEGEENENG